jgi:hypothetical protein
MKKCFHCNNDTTNPKFCSRSCAAKVTNKTPKRKITRICSKCNNTVKDYRSTLCNIHFEIKKQQSKEVIENHTLEYYFSKDSLKSLHVSSKAVHIRQIARRWFKNLLKLPCAKCGYNKHVELCHIKPIKSFPVTATIKEVNSKENIIQLCPNCHWELDNL